MYCQPNGVLGSLMQPGPVPFQGTIFLIQLLADFSHLALVVLEGGEPSSWWQVPLCRQDWQCDAKHGARPAGERELGS